MSLHKKTLHPALKYSIFKVEHFLSELAQFQAHSHVDERGWEVRGMVYLDFRSLCLITAMRRVGGRLVPYSLRFKLTGPHRRHAAPGPRGSGRRLDPYSRRFKLTERHRRHAAWRHSRQGRGGGGAGGEGGGESTGGEGGRGVKGDRDFKF
jgi:hypothetical protein